MDTVQRSSDSTTRVHGTLQGAESHQRKEARTLKEKMEEEKKKKRGFHDELVLTEEHIDDESAERDSKNGTAEESEDSVSESKNRDRDNPVDDNGHVDFRA